MSSLLRLACLASLVVTLAAVGCRGRIDEPGSTGSTSAAAPASPARPVVGTPLPDDAFKVEWGKPEVPATFGAGQNAVVRVTVTNKSSTAWSNQGGAGAYAVRLSYRWWARGADSPVAPYEARVDLSKPLAPGASENLGIEVTAPPKPGAYQLQLDLVQELVCWFEAKGAAELKIPVMVR